MMTREHRQPDYHLVVDGTDITPRVKNGRLVSLTLTENRSDEADTLNLVISDHDGQMALPPHGAVIELALGWVDEELVSKGQFTVDETEHSGTPDVITIRARSANFRGDLPGKKSRSWYRVTLGELVQEIAKDHDLEPIISERLARVRLPAPQQTAESDMSFLTRLAEPHDALVTVKEGRLLFLRKSQATTASGQLLPPVTVERNQTDTHRYTLVERDAYTGVRAKWNDLMSGRYQWVVAGTDEQATELPETYSSEVDALAAANAEWQRLQRGLASLQLTLVPGRPELAPETPVECRGWKADINEKSWVAARVAHILDENGLVTIAEANVLAT